MTRTRALVDTETLTELFPHRVAGVTDLTALGLTSSTIYARCQPGGLWQRIAPGVVLLGNTPPSRAQLIAAALRHTGPDAVVTGWDALIRHGMTSRAGPGAVHVLVPHHRQVQGTEHVLVERTVRLPKPVLCQGFPIAPLPRAAIDTARRLRSTDVTRALLAEVVQRGRTPLTQLRRELDAGSGRGSALPRRVLAEVSTGVRSLAEAWARRLVQRAALPAPRWNCPVRAPDGELLGIVDAWWDDVGLAWELTAYQFTPSPEDHRAATRRATRLTAAGIVVVHTPAATLRNHPTAVLDQLRHAHHRATHRPRPPVTAGLAGAS